MKELSIEQKAQRYDEAYKKVAVRFGSNVADEIFLKESEDEKIRQTLIHIVKGACSKYGIKYQGQEISEEKLLAWLEKQGEPIDKIVKRAMTEKQRVLLTETNGDANIDWDTRSLQDAITLLKHGLNYLQEIEVKKQTMPSSRFGGCYEYIPTRFDKEKQGKQGKQNPVKVPKFKVGDFIQFNGMGHTRYTIKEVCGLSHYINSFDKRMDMAYTDANFELVERKPANKVEPKFHEGDWVIDKQGIVHQIANVIENVTYHTYGYDIVGGGYFNDNTEGVRLWTIQDAKDGDVLVSSSGKPFIFNGLFDNDPMAYGGLVADDSFWPASNSNWTTAYCKPATKEQRDLLFSKMKEAGYEWDAEKKELKKIEQMPAAWSEEDEDVINHLLAICAGAKRYRRQFAGCLQEDITKYQTWLKSLKDRVQSCISWKPSDEQITALDSAIHCYAGISPTNNREVYALELMKEQLKKLK